MTAAHTFTRRIFRDFFPPPRFLEMPAVGLDISDTAVTALELVRHRDAFRVGRFGRRSLPAGAIADGYVHDKEKVIAELSALKKELRLNLVNGSLPEEKAYLYTAQLPAVSHREMRAAIEFTLEENVPLSPAETIFDYTVIHNTPASRVVAESSGGGQPKREREEPPPSPDSLEVSVTVLPRAVVHTYTEIFHGAGLIPLSFELGAQAICRAVISRGDRGTYLIVQRGAKKTGLFIVRNEAVYFTATVAENSVSEEKAPRIFTGLDSHGRGESGGKEITREAAPPSPPSLYSGASSAGLSAEIGRVITYWQTHAGGGGESASPIGKIVLCGAGATAPQLRESLSRELALPIEFAHVWRNAFSYDSYIPQILFEESFDYAAAVGLALPKGHW